MKQHAGSVRMFLCLWIALHAVPGARGADPARSGPAEHSLQVKLGLPFQDNAVLQQKIPLPVWGTSLPGARATVTFDDQSKTTVAGKDGAWRVVLDPMDAVRLTSVNEAPEGRTLAVVCEKDGERAVEEIRNVIVGEVWIASGQSNMAGKLGTHKDRHFPEDTLEKANYPALRQMLAPTDGPWQVCTPETAVWFKKVGFFFARRVQRDAMVPLGIITAAVGGSSIEGWLNQAPFERGSQYEKHIAPLVGYGLRGVLWYQGESNAGDRRKYSPKLRSLIVGWRDAWKQPDSKAADGPRGDFSFYLVQLPGIGVPGRGKPAGGDGRAEIRQAFFSALAIKNTGMAVAIDVGAEREHPPNKYDTGVRLARWALHRDYNFKDLVPSGPLYKSHTIEGIAIRVRFDHAGSGLMLAEKEGFLPPKPTPDAALKCLSIRDRNGAWHWADGKIDGAELIVSCKDVKNPIAVKYGYTNHPVGSLLYNKDGLPASPFSTDGYGEEREQEK